MKQYETVYPHFKFLGAVPLDCNDLSFCPLHKIDYDEHKKNGITNLAVVFNYDRYGQPGSHWVALFIDLAQGHIYYCDSMGRKPIANINIIIDEFKEYYQKIGTVTYQYNPHSYQEDGSECGVYSCNFIIRLLAGEPFDQIITKPLTFKEINSCRNVYFRNKPSSHSGARTKCDPRVTKILIEKYINTKIC